jgi:hypothetical protein
MAYSHDIFLWDSGNTFGIKLSEQGLSLVVNSTNQAQYSQPVGIALRVNDTTQAITSENPIINSHNPGNTVLSKVGSFNADTVKNIGETQAISGIGFQPKVVLFWWTGSHSTIDAVVKNNSNNGFGVGTSASSIFYVDISLQDATTTSLTSSAMSGTNVIGIYSDYDSLGGEFNLQSMDLDGFTLIVNTKFVNDYRISYLALGGDELKEIYVGSLNTPTSLGNYTTSVGFKPDAIIFANTDSTSDIYRTDAKFQIGWAASNGGQGTIAGESNYLGGTSNTMAYGYGGEVITSTTVAGTPGTIGLRESFVDFTNNGFILNHLEGAASRLIHYIAFKGGIYQVNQLNTRTDTNLEFNTLGFKPSAVLFASIGQPQCTQDIPIVDNRISIGAMANNIDTSITQAVTAMVDVDNLGTMYVYNANYDTAVYANIHQYESSAVYLMDVPYVATNGFYTKTSIVDNARNWVTYLAIGGNPRIGEHILLVNNAVQIQTSENTILVPLINFYQSNAAIMVEYEVDSYMLVSNAAIMVEYNLHVDLLVNDVTQLQTSDNVIITYIPEPLTLTIQDTTQLQTSDDVIITYNLEIPDLIIQDIIQLQTSENIILTSHYNIAYQTNSAIIIEYTNLPSATLTSAAIIVEYTNLPSATLTSAAIMVEYNLRFSLIVQDITQLQTSDNITFIMAIVFTIQDSAQLQSSDNVNLIQHYLLTINNITQLQNSDNINLIQHYLLTINNITQLQNSDNISLTQHYVLTINNSTHLQASDNISLTQHYLLAINNSTHLQTSDNIDLTQHYLLIINNTSQILISDNIDLIQHSVLAINNSTHFQASDNISLTQNNILITNNVTQIQVVDNIILNYHAEEAFVLEIQNGTQLQISSNIILTQYYILSINNSIQLQACDNIILTQHHTLSINSTIQLQISNNINLVQNYILLINNTTQLQNSDNVILIQHQILISNNAIQLQISGNILLIQNQVLVINNVIHLQISGNILLTQHYNLTISYSTQLQASDNVVLTQHNILSILNATHLQFSDNVQILTVGILGVHDSTQLQLCNNVIITGHGESFSLIINNTAQIQTSNNISLTFYTAPESGPYFSKVGSFNIDTSKTVGQTQSIRELGFQPKVILFWWHGSTSIINEVSGSTISFGISSATSGTNRGMHISISEDNQASTDAYSYSSAVEIVRIYTDTDTIDGILDFYSIDSNGFTVIVNDQFTKTYRINYLALGGSDVTNARVGYDTFPVPTGNKSYTGVGFKPDAALFFTGFTASLPLGSLQVYHSIGMATSSSNQGVISTTTADNQTTSNARGYGNNQDVTANLTFSSTTCSRRNSFVSFDNDGFTLNNMDGTAALYFFYVCIKGGRYSVGDLTTVTDGSDIVETVGFKPKTLLFMSANRAHNTRDVNSVQGSMSIGAATSTSNRIASSFWSENGLPDTETAFSVYDDAVYVNIKDDGVIGKMDLKSLDSTGFTTVMDTPDPSGCWVMYLAIGESVIKNAIQIQTATNITIVYNPLTLVMNNCSQVQTGDNLRIETNIHIIIAQASVQIQFSDNIRIETSIYMLGMIIDSTQIITSENILLGSGTKKYIYAHRKISFGIGKKGVGI